MRHAHPRHRSLLPSTVHSALALVNIICINTGGCTLSISVKPGSAAHLPTSMASAGLQHLSVGACVHLVWFRAASHRVWPSPRANVFCASHMIQQFNNYLAIVGARANNLKYICSTRRIHYFEGESREPTTLHNLLTSNSIYH